MDKVSVMQKQFRDYFESVLQNEIDSRKTPKGKEKFIIHMGSQQPRGDFYIVDVY